MTDRIKGLTVVLERDMLRGVARVRMLVDDPADYINRERVRRELYAKLLDVLADKDEP